MVEIKPFKGLLYNPDKIADHSSVLAPPYDVISEENRNELYDKSDYGIIRLILGKDQQSDSTNDNKYIRAKQDLDSWVKKGILTKDEKQSFYVYYQKYEVNGVTYTRSGFMGLMKIQDPGEVSVLPHEYTLAKPKQDRMNLITQVRSNLSPIFMLFEDKEKQVTEILNDTMKNHAPIIDVNIDGVVHRLWRLFDENKLKGITAGLKTGKTIIADGHHRFEVARRYRELRKEESGYDGSADHVMVYFTDMSHPETLKVFPTHRVVKKLTLDNGKALEKIQEYFSIDYVEDMEALRLKLEEKSNMPNIFGLYFQDKYLILIPKDVHSLRGLITEDKSDYWKELDVSVLQYAVFDKILGIDKEEGNITFVKTFEEAEKITKDKSHVAAFLLNATRVEQLKAVAELGEMMPQKSTYFYPKLLSGLVINKFEDVTANV